MISDNFTLGLVFHKPPLADKIFIQLIYFNVHLITQCFIFFVDGAAANMSPNVGVHRLIELQLKKPLQRIGCMYHMAELPVRHLMQLLDGGTSGPIGESLLGSAKIEI